MHFWFYLISLSLALTRCKLTYIKNKSGAYRPEAKIVGGKAVPLERYPSAVLFFNVGAQCAGTILNSWTVLTAAHCFDINTNVNDMAVEVGARFIYDTKATLHAVDSIVIHPDYNGAVKFACDIALVFVQNPIQFTNKVKKAILVNSNKWMNTKENKFEAIGWGLTEYGGSKSKEGLLMVELGFVTSQACARLHQLQISPDMFCLYGQGTKDTCKGDSGGGILWNDMVVGITSHGDGCAKKDKPSVYANVWYFRNWIRSQIERYFNRDCKPNKGPGRRELPLK